VIVELPGTEEKIEAFLELMKPYGITEMARTGIIAMARGGNQAPVAESTPAKRRKRSLDAPTTEALPPS
jgi:acetolactate synthase-1/3 small subunit